MRFMMVEASFAGKEPKKFEIKPGLKPGDWTCPNCGANVYASRLARVTVCHGTVLTARFWSGSTFKQSKDRRVAH